MAAKKKTTRAGKRSAGKSPRKAKSTRTVSRAPAKKAAVAKKAKAKAKSPVKAAPKKAVRKIAAAKPAQKAKAKPKAAQRAKPILRRDGSGHLNPRYAADLRAGIHRHEDDSTAFLGGSRSGDDLAEELGEEVVETATSGEYEAEDALNQSVPEDRGGPFVPSTAGAEFDSEDVDESNPRGATREPFPTT
jgi:hypothetical protein